MTVSGKKKGRESEGWKEEGKERTGRDATFHSKAAGMGFPCRDI